MSVDLMRRALALAERGAGRVSPNPMVGAVLARAGRVVGEGFHRRFGGAHAEVEAIRSAGRRARGATLFVTMEPCCFCGKTGACTEAIVKAGISRVVAATSDPDPRVSGRGFRCLRASGIEVSTGVLGSEARRLNEAYFCAQKFHRPFFLLHAALTLDGMMATRSGESQWITGPVARRQAMRLRCRCDAIVVGVETVVNDNPRLNCRGMRRRPILRVILDTRLRTPPDARLFGLPGPVLVFTAERDSAGGRCFAQAGAEVVGVNCRPDGLLSWPDIAAELHRRSVQSVLIEGGARTASSAIEAGVVDKLVVFQAPVLMGPGRCVSSCLSARSFSEMVRLSRVRHEVLGPDVMIEGYIVRRGER